MDIKQGGAERLSSAPLYSLCFYTLFAKHWSYSPLVRSMQLRRCEQDKDLRILRRGAYIDVCDPEQNVKATQYCEAYTKLAEARQATACR